MIQTFDDMVNWVKANVPSDKYSTAEGAAEWFIALQESRMIQDSMTAKDMARLVIDGLEPLDVNKWVSDLYEYEDESEHQSINDELIAGLKQHFNI